MASSPSPRRFDFFVAAKFNPPKTWMYAAGIIEIIIPDEPHIRNLPVYAAASASPPARPGAAIYKVTKGKWIWIISGGEYCVFWTMCCLVVAMHYRGNFV